MRGRESVQLGSSHMHVPEGIRPPELGHLLEIPGAVVGPYRLLDQVGRGGFGTVWRAVREHPFEQQVAVKLIKLGMDSEAVLARFDHERRAMALMDHPGIARAIDGGITDRGRAYFVMEYVDGMPITDFCDRRTLGLHERALLLAQACDAIQHAHQRGFIHRDLKPSNILVRTRDDGSPEVKIIDFGIAKALASSERGMTVTEAGELVGTPEYMSPEQADIDGGTADTRSDVWSLGAVLYELLTGNPPIGSHGDPDTTRASTMRQLREGSVPRPRTRAAGCAAADAAARGTTPQRLAHALRREPEWICMKSLRRSPDERYESAGAFARDLRRWVSGEPVQAGPESVAYRLRAYARTHRTQVAAAVAVLASLVAATATSTWFALRESRARAESEARATETARIAELQSSVLSRIDPAWVGAAIVQDALNRHRDVLVATEPDASVRKPLLATMYKEMIKLNKADIGRDVIDRWIVTPTEKSIDEQLADMPAAASGMRHQVAKRRWVLGQLDAADALARRALGERERLIGPDATATLETVHLLGMITWSRGDAAAAIPLLARARDGRTAALGDRHPDAVESATQHANALAAAGRAAEAVPLLRALLTIQQESFGDASAEAAGAQRDLGAALAQVGAHEEAVTLLRAAWQRRVALIGPNAPGTVATHAMLASSLAKSGARAEAIGMLMDALALMERSHGTRDLLTLSYRTRLGELLLEDGFVDDAVGQLTQARDALLAGFGADHPITRECDALLSRASARRGAVDSGRGSEP
ncbi:MAG: tetratricopeptide repeat protein [Phycisphaerales bacterium]|nr:tetratricopeptide repeat protein [Phycisphaerales bacterium]